jgi:hypothetical protein
MKGVTTVPATVEVLSGERILVVTITNPFKPDVDMPRMFDQTFRLIADPKEPFVQIVDLSSIDSTGDFSQMLAAMGHAASMSRNSRAAGIGRPPSLVFVGTGPLAKLAANAMGQTQYGGAGGHICSSREEAIVLARTLLTSGTQPPAE